jgi:hypothetical protein
LANSPLDIQQRGCQSDLPNPKTGLPDTVVQLAHEHRQTLECQKKRGLGLNWPLLLPLLVTAGVAIIGWWVGHWFSMQRDRASKRRDMRLQFLMDAYRRLESASNRPLSAEYAPDFEKAIADIQLFGSVEQVRMTQNFVFAFAEKRSASMDDLLEGLRQALRKEIGLPEVTGRIAFLRIEFPKDKK